MGSRRRARPHLAPARTMRLHRFSDRTLRTTAWVVTTVAVTTTVLGVPLKIAAPGPHVSWGQLAGDLAWETVVSSFAVAGLLILRSQPRNRIGWLLQGIGLVHALSSWADSYSFYGLLVNPGSVPAPDVTAALTGGAWALEIGLMGTFLILLFPDGHLPSSRWRPVAWTAAASIAIVTLAIPFFPGRLDESAVPDTVNPLGSEAAKPVLIVLLAVFLPLLPACILACAAALVQRFRHSHGFERLQLRWLATAGAFVATLYGITLVATWLVPGSTFAGRGPLWLWVLQTVCILSFALLPAAIGVAVLRHGLYGIDVVINHTLVYGALTGALLTTYASSVLVLRPLLSPLTGDSDLAVALSTLTVAALFRPGRARIQAAVDRRFYRRKLDAAQALDDFAADLRHELDLDAVAGDLCAAARDTMQPAHVSLWLRP